MGFYITIYHDFAKMHGIELNLTFIYVYENSIPFSVVYHVN